MGRAQPLPGEKKELLGVLLFLHVRKLLKNMSFFKF
jgi:hypothetical protein